MAKKKPSKRSRDDADDVDFEQALAEVEHIVDELEGGELGLQDSLQQYEFGIKRLKQCHALLQNAERKVMLLSGLDADGNPIGTPFAGTEDEAEESEGSDEYQSSQTRENHGSTKSRNVDDLPGLF